MAIVKHLLEYGDRFMKLLIIASMALMVLVITLQVVLRFAFNNALPWPEEAARYLMIWSLYLGCCYVHLEEGHVSLTYFSSKLPERLSIINSFLIDICILAFLLVLAYYGVLIASSLADINTPALRISKAIPYICIPVGAIIMAGITIKQLSRHVSRITKGKSKPNK